jgi:hypothetical protein
MTEQLKPLVSTANLGEPQQVEQFKGVTLNASQDGAILLSELQPSFLSLLDVLASNAKISETDPTIQLAETVPALKDFITTLQKSIVDVKAATVAGQLLTQQLNDAVITQAQYATQIDNIVVPTPNILAALSPTLPGALQSLIFSISNDAELKKINEIISSAAVTTPGATNEKVSSAAVAAPGETAEKKDTAFDSTNEAESLALLSQLLQAQLNNNLPIAAAQDAFVQATLAKIEAANGQALTAAQKATLTSEITQFFTATLSKLPSTQALVAAVQNATQFNSIIGNAILLSNQLPKVNKGDNFPSGQGGKENENEVNKGDIFPKGVELEKKNQGDSFAGGKNLDEKAVADKPGPAAIPKKVVADKPAKNFLTQLLEIAQKNLQTSAAALLSLGNQPKIVSGARAVIKINGKVSALCTNVSCDISMNWQEIRGVDELVPNDLSPTEYTVKGSMTLYRVPNRSPIASYLTPDMFRSLIWPYSTIEIKDKRTDEVLLLVKRCVITSRTEQFNPRQLTTTVLTFVGIGMRDEEAPQLIPTPLPSSVSGGGLLGALGSLGSSIAGVFGGGGGGGSGASGNDGG